MNTAEYLQEITVPAGGSARFNLPAAGIAGVYCSAPVGIAWDFNGTTADIKTASEWEPLGGFIPAPTSALIFDNAGGGTAVTVTIRCYE